MSEKEQPLLPARPRVGLALGSGSARGWAHIGIIQALEERGIEIDVVAGTSIGALVGGAYVSGALKEFGDWVRTLTTKDVFGLMDFTFSGGVVKGEKLFGFFEKLHSNPNIEDLEKRFVTVATDMKSGREVWISKGPVLDAARASCALPGLFSPLQHQRRWKQETHVLQRRAVLDLCSLQRRPSIARLSNKQRWPEAPGEWRHCGLSICQKFSLGVEPPKLCTWYATPPGDCVPLIPGDRLHPPKYQSHGHPDWPVQTALKSLDQAS